MKINIIAFAHARETFGFSHQIVPCHSEETPRDILLRVVPNASLSHLRVALDYEYTHWDAPIGFASELAIIPPVSGG